MQNRRMERSAAYAGIVGALLFLASGLIPGQFPPYSAGASTIATYLSGHVFSLTLAAWLELPAVAFILWFAFGFFDYLRSPNDTDRALSQWGSAAVVVASVLTIVSGVLQFAAVARPADIASIPAWGYVFDIGLFVFAMGSFGAFAFAVAHVSRRKNAMPGWLNWLGYLVFIVDALFTLSIFSTSVAWSITGYGSYVAPLLTSIWIIVASIVLATRTSQSA